MMSERELLSQLIVEADYRVAGRTIPATRYWLRCMGYAGACAGRTKAGSAIYGKRR
jgi:hypothetical protein